MTDIVAFAKSLNLTNKVTGKKIELYPYQLYALSVMEKNQKTIIRHSRQVGTTLLTKITAAYYLTTNVNYDIGFICNNTNMAKHVSLEFLDMLNEKDISEKNKFNIRLNNGSNIKFFSASTNSLCSKSFDYIIIDNLEYNHNVRAFLLNLYTTIKSVSTQKLLYTINKYDSPEIEKLWLDANKGENGFVPHTINWCCDPTRTYEWYVDIVRSLGENHSQQIF